MMKRLNDYSTILEELTSHVQKQISEMQKEGLQEVTGTAFEAIVYKELLEIGFCKEQIEHSIRKFPDFIISDDENDIQIGLEIKKTNEDKWKVPGGSVYESLRNQIEETYVLMGKFGGTPEAKIRKYAECIEDLKVTHSPRFHLDLELEKGADYLTRNHAEDLLDLSEGPELNKRIRELLRTSKDTWYSEQMITAYSDLDTEEKDKYFVDGVVLFPEVVGRDYTKFAPWMIYKWLVWCRNIRDVFSSGGIVLNNGIYVSAVMNRIILQKEKIFQRICEMSIEEVKQHWNVETENVQDRINIWTELIAKNIKFSKKVISKNKELDVFYGEQEMIIRQKIVQKFQNKLNEDLLVFYYGKMKD